MESFKAEVVLFLFIVFSLIGTAGFINKHSNAKIMEQHLNQLTFCVKE